MQYEQPSAKKVDVLIVGAGISGLTSAYKLIRTDPSIHIRVLESSNCLGGEIKTHNLGELGAKWYTEDQYHIHRLYKSLNLVANKRVILAPHLKPCFEIDRGMFGFLAKFELNRYINALEIKTELFKPTKRQKWYILEFIYLN